MVTTADELGTLAEGKSLQQHRLEMGMEAHRVYCDGRHIALPLIGFRLLACFLKSPDRVHRRETLNAAGWRNASSVEHDELASAYRLTAHEIGILQTRLGTIDSEEKFAAFVNEAERAFSREHTQWVAPQIDNAPYISRKLREIIGGDDNDIVP